MKFSVRDLLLLTVIVALAVGWWLDRGHLAEERLNVKAWQHLHFKELREARSETYAYKSYLETIRSVPKFSARAANPPKE